MADQPQIVPPSHELLDSLEEGSRAVAQAKEVVRILSGLYPETETNNAAFLASRATDELFRLRERVAELERAQPATHVEESQIVGDLMRAYAAISRTGYEDRRPDGVGYSWQEYAAERSGRNRAVREEVGTLTWFDLIDDLVRQAATESEPRHLYRNLMSLAAFVLLWAVQVQRRIAQGKWAP